MKKIQFYILKIFQSLDRMMNNSEFEQNNKISMYIVDASVCFAEINLCCVLFSPSVYFVYLHWLVFKETIIH